VKSNFAGRGMYMPQSIKRDSVPANLRNREAVTLALEGRYVQYLNQALHPRQLHTMPRRQQHFWLR
ncbi:hypothetical protein ABHD20_25655, partial [Enterobacter cloacae]|uniref:hypothetical protein n=1 Tax=Enterobacter cloacae TaxID=550 RepID=UPI00325AC03D